MMQSGHLQQTPSWGHCQVCPQHSKGWALGQSPARECRVPYQAWACGTSSPISQGWAAGRAVSLLSCGQPGVWLPKGSSWEGAWLGLSAPPSWCWPLLLSNDKALLDFSCCFLPACPHILSPTNFSRSPYNFEVPVTSNIYPLGNSKTRPLSHKTQSQDQICPWEFENPSFET